MARPMPEAHGLAGKGAASVAQIGEAPDGFAGPLAGASMAPTSRSASASTCFTSCRREPQATRAPRCFWISLDFRQIQLTVEERCSVPS